jgi:hypothetical protein
MQDEVIAIPTPQKRVPWNKGRLTGAKPAQHAADPGRTCALRVPRIRPDTRGQRSPRPAAYACAQGTVAHLRSPADWPPSRRRREEGCRSNNQ